MARSDAIIGWDIGGAHVKAARIEAGRAVEAVQMPCPLWQGLAHLDRTLAKTTARLGSAKRHAVTMTGEMADCFKTRAEGVGAISGRAERKLPGEVRIFAGRRGFVAPSAARKHWRDVASANWLATAACAARNISEGILMDVGSTTTDIVPIAGGRVAARGFSDAARLGSGELVYTGIARTPVMAVASHIRFKGEPQGIAAEVFATMADAYRVAGLLPEGADDFPAADGGGKTARDSARRLARMLGRELDEGSTRDWEKVARDLIEMQAMRIEAALNEVLDGGAIGATAPVIAAGAGSFLARSIAARLGRRAIDFAEAAGVAKSLAYSAAVCAPAFAVGFLTFED